MLNLARKYRIFDTLAYKVLVEVDILTTYGRRILYKEYFVEHQKRETVYRKNRVVRIKDDFQL